VERPFGEGEEFIDGECVSKIKITKTPQGKEALQIRTF